jgi:hypothetical protein
MFNNRNLVIFKTTNNNTHMKKLVFTALLAATGFGLYAQNIDKIKDLYKNKKLAEAKTQVDQFVATEKNAKNGEGWYMKAKIYGDIAADKTLAALTPDARWQAYEALKKYVEVDDKKQLQLQLEQYKPIMDIYQGYFKDGAAQYNANDFKSAFPNFQKCLAVSEYMQQQKWSTVTLDTSVVLYTGISAEKAGLKEEAATYYGKLAEAKVNGEGMVEIYKWLVDHYYNKKDATNAAKYMALGKEVYPADAFWSTMELDMMREKGDKAGLFAKYEDIIAKEPNNHLYRYNYAVELYQEGYKPAVADRPKNSDELLKKAEENIRKTIELKPDYSAANLVLGQLLYNQGVDLSTQSKAIKPAAANAKLKPEDQKKKDELKAGMTKKLDEALVYLEKVDQTLGSQGKLKMEDKNYLKDALDIIINIYDQKGNKEKVKVYEDKFNSVDKIH